MRGEFSRKMLTESGQPDIAPQCETKQWGVGEVTPEAEYRLGYQEPGITSRRAKGGRSHLSLSRVCKTEREGINLVPEACSTMRTECVV